MWTKEEPFCLVYQHKGPHRPFTPAPRHKDLYSDQDFPYPETFDDDYATRLIAGKAADMKFEQSLAKDYGDALDGMSEREKRSGSTNDLLKTIIGPSKASTKASAKF